ncbi:hypothetical protein IQ07DRAFT_669131 [Pyrenochaeta sp. DS3sAY3a]|nr:hypothetical protein IQ07DRAFT_669131 [Pyrenochaeta sp. DS3sAY3a]
MAGRKDLLRNVLRTAAIMRRLSMSKTQDPVSREKYFAASKAVTWAMSVAVIDSKVSVAVWHKARAEQEQQYASPIDYEQGEIDGATTLYPGRNSEISSKARVRSRQRLLWMMRMMTAVSAALGYLSKRPA